MSIVNFTAQNYYGSNGVKLVPVSVFTQSFTGDGTTNHSAKANPSLYGQDVERPYMTIDIGENLLGNPFASDHTNIHAHVEFSCKLKKRQDAVRLAISVLGGTTLTVYSESEIFENPNDATLETEFVHFVRNFTFPSLTDGLGRIQIYLISNTANTDVDVIRRTYSCVAFRYSEIDSSGNDYYIT